MEVNHGGKFFSPMGVLTLLVRTIIFTFVNNSLMLVDPISFLKRHLYRASSQ